MRTRPPGSCQSLFYKTQWKEVCMEETASWKDSLKPYPPYPLGADCATERCQAQSGGTSVPNIEISMDWGMGLPHSPACTTMLGGHGEHTRSPPQSTCRRWDLTWRHSHTYLRPYKTHTLPICTGRKKSQTKLQSLSYIIFCLVLSNIWPTLWYLNEGLKITSTHPFRGSKKMRPCPVEEVAREMAGLQEDSGGDTGCYLKDWKALLLPHLLCILFFFFLLCILNIQIFGLRSAGWN